MTVPGAVAGWEALRARFGTLPMADILAPAIFYADDGFPGLGHHRRDVGRRARTSWPPRPNAAQTYLPNGRAPRAGEVFRNPRSRRIAAAHRGAAGRPAFYKGRIADAILALSRERGGTMTAADLKEFEPEWVEPDLHDLSRLDGLRAAAQHAGHRRADDAQPDGAVSAGASTDSTAPTRCT